MKTRLKALFERSFGSAEGARYYFAPGRVNLIGEHTDYNGGHVFPCALSMGIYCAARAREDGMIRLYSAAFPDVGIFECSSEELLACADGEALKALINHKVGESASGHLGSSAAVKDAGWTIYPLGSLKSMADAGYWPEKGPAKLPGLDMTFDADLPTGSGLSSSAAMEVLTLTAAASLWGVSLPGKEKALIAQAAENRFAGVPCGIMDQFASAMGKKDHAIFLDTETLDYEFVPLELGDARIVITNSMVKHSLASSAYAERRRECSEALEDLQAAAGGTQTVPSLCPIGTERFEEIAGSIKDPICRRRARHAVYEDGRTLLAAALLKKGDLKGFGKLMNESHASLRDDYEVSCPELDALAETAQSVPGVLGSRMTGGGFGGCTVSIVEGSSLEAFKKTVRARYKELCGLDCEIYVADPAEGAREI